MTDERAWRRPYFHGRSCRCRECVSPSGGYLARFGLLVAPTPDRPSDAMCEIREASARDAERDDRFWLAVRGYRERQAEERRRADHQQLRDLVAEFGADVLERIARRTDLGFTLPDDLKGER